MKPSSAFRAAVRLQQRVLEGVVQLLSSIMALVCATTHGGAEALHVFMRTHCVLASALAKGRIARAAEGLEGIRCIADIAAPS